MLKDKGLTFNVAFTSVLSRAIKTLFYIQDTMGLHWTPVYRDWRLNERHYGALQGLNKSETAAKHGEEQVKVRAGFRPRPVVPTTTMLEPSSNSTLTLVQSPTQFSAKRALNSVQIRDGSIVSISSIISAIPILSVSYRIGVSNIGFFDISISYR